jgi:hypothetical protein
MRPAHNSEKTICAVAWLWGYYEEEDLDSIWRGHDINDTRTLMSNYDEALLQQKQKNTKRQVLGFESTDQSSGLSPCALLSTSAYYVCCRHHHAV